MVPGAGASLYPEHMITLILLVLALVFFIVAAFLNVTSRVNFVALGLASLTGALIATHFGV